MDAMDGGFLVHLHSPNQRKTIGKWWFNGILIGFTLWESNMAMGNTGKSPNNGGLHLGKSSINGPFYIAIFDYQRVKSLDSTQLKYSPKM